MKQLLWLGLLFLSASWLFFIPQYTMPDVLLGALFIILGIACTIAALWRSTPQHVDKKYFFLLIPLIFTLVVIPYPYNLGIVVLAIGLFLYLMLYRVERAYAIPRGITLAGVLLIIQTAVFPVYAIFVSHGHRIDLLSPVVSWVGNLLGLHASTDNGIVFIQTIQQTYPVTTTWDKLGCYLWLNMVLGALLIFFLFYERRKILRTVSIFLITSIVYAILRYVAVLYGYLTTTEPSIFWNPLYMTLSFVPFALLLMKLIPLNDSDLHATWVPSLVLTKKHLLAMIMVFLLVFSVVGAFTFQDPGVKKNGRVLIDEFHSEWEDSTRALDKEWYGQLSTYNYYSWAEWLGYYYDVERNINNTFTTELLRQYDILILKCPTDSYSEQEVHAIVQFVDNGGGLYLIGDHTNVFGMNTFLNQVSERFGIRFNTDATYEMGTGDLSVYQPDPLFPHVVMQHVGQFDFMTSCTVAPTSLLTSATMENIIIGNRVTSEPGTYATENFFRESIGSPDSEYGFILQAAAIKHGKGRVVAFTDSTVFSSFSMFTDGYSAFTLGAVDYLNRINTYAYFNIVFLCTSVLSLAILLVLLKDTKKIKVLWLILVAGLFAFSAAAPLFSSVNMINYPIPLAHTDYPQVCFEQEHSWFNVSVKPTIVLFNDNNNYGTFFVWTQRVRCVPLLTATLADAVARGDVIVLINPTQPFEETDVTTLTNFLEAGGKILLMDGIRNSKSTANDLLGNFGLVVTTSNADHLLYRNGSDIVGNVSAGRITAPYLSLTGGEQIFINEKNVTYASMIKFQNETTGKIGKLVVVVDSYAFSDAIMGGTFTEPDGRQRQIYETEFFLFEQVLLKD